MRATRALFALLVGLAACQPAAPPAASSTPADEAAVRKNLDDYAPLTLAKNWDGIVALWTADGVRFAPNQPVLQHDAMKKFLETYPPITAFEAAPEHVDINGTLAVATGHYSLTAMVPGQKAPVSDKGKWFVILKKQADGSWKRTHDGWNSDLPIPAK